VSKEEGFVVLLMTPPGDLEVIRLTPNEDEAVAAAKAAGTGECRAILLPARIYAHQEKNNEHD
jgi:hypothetical protein